MYYYFCADFPAIIKINGIYYGTIYQTVKFINAESDKSPFIEVCSLLSSERNVNVLLDSHFFHTPPENVVITDLDGGYMIKFKKCFIFEQFNVLCQQKLPNAVVTVFTENGLKLSIESPNDFYAQTIKYNAGNVSVDNVTIDGQELIAVSLTDSNTLLLIFDIRDKIIKIFEREVSSYNFENGFSTTENLLDIAKHTVISSWEYQNGTLTEKNKRVNCSNDFDKDKLNEKILPYAFLEEFLCGGNIDDYLSDNVKENKLSLKDYLGDFIGIMPPPSFKKYDYIGLIYSKHQNVYFVKYFRFELSNRKICNLTKVE